MTRTEQQIETSFQVFCARHPEFSGDEATMRAMHAVIQEQGLDARIPEHLSLAFLKVRPAPVPQPAETVDELTAAANQLIASGQVSKQSIAAMTADAYALAIQRPEFVRADE